MVSSAAVKTEAQLDASLSPADRQPVPGTSPKPAFVETVAPAASPPARGMPALAAIARRPAIETAVAAGSAAVWPHLAQAVAPVAARQITLTRRTVDLVKFIPFTDFVTCDYNQDGRADILALNFRISTGFGATGVGNGLFHEGPSFDLPFRPAAAAQLGSSRETLNGLFLISAMGSVSLFYPLISDGSSTGATAPRFSAVRVDTPDGPIFAVAEEGTTSVHLYAFGEGRLQDRGEKPASRSLSFQAWYNDAQGWAVDGSAPFPFPPAGGERLVSIDDLNGDAIPDLVYYESAKLVWLLSKDGNPLVDEKTISCPTGPTAIRTADVDGNGLPDVLVLIGSAGVLEVYLSTAE
jgi:hypothetical protein